MLNEIFKGMDNASEAINENFQFGSIVEDNLNEGKPESGYYVMFGNGLQLCWGKFNHNFDETRDAFPIFSKAFKNTNYYVGVSGGDNSWQSVETSISIGAGPSTISSPRVVGSPRAETFYGLRAYTYYAVGTWK